MHKKEDYLVIENKQYKVLYLLQLQYCLFKTPKEKRKKQNHKPVNERSMTVEHS